MIKEGWIDYIVPQIYWNRGFKVADYDILVEWWANEVKGTDVKLYIVRQRIRLKAGKSRMNL